MTTRKILLHGIDNNFLIFQKYWKPLYDVQRRMIIVPCASVIIQGLLKVNKLQSNSSVLGTRLQFGHWSLSANLWLPRRQIRRPREALAGTQAETSTGRFHQKLRPSGTGSHVGSRCSITIFSEEEKKKNEISHFQLVNPWHAYFSPNFNAQVVYRWCLLILFLVIFHSLLAIWHDDLWVTITNLLAVDWYCYNAAVFAIDQ